MKKLFLFLISLSAFLFSSISLAVIQPERNPDFVAPSETTTLRGGVSVCRSPGPTGGKGGLSFLQTGRGPCPTEPRTAKGWDRPEYENESPGIPFKNKGLE